MKDPNNFYGDGGGAPEDDTVNQDSKELFGNAGDDDLGTYWQSTYSDMDGSFGAASLYGGEGNDGLYFDLFFDSGQMKLVAVTHGTLDGGDGNDKLIGGDTTTTDYLYGGAGDDYASGGSTSDLGSDYLDGGEGRDALYGQSGSDTLYGGDGDDDGAIVQVSKGLTTFAVSGLYGGAGNDWLYGGAGNDFVDGGTGADILVGGLGNDTFLVDSVGDQVFEDRGGFAGHFGVDTVLTSASFALSTYAEVEFLTSAGTGLSLTGSEFANTITGDAGNNTLAGNGDNDTLSGYLGNDSLYGGTSNDALDAGAGNDRLYGNSGKDTLTGGSGKDIFVFDSTPHKTTNVDRITDFRWQDDTLHLDNAYLKKVGPNGKLKADAFHLGRKAADAEDRVIYDKGTGSLYYDADGTGKAAAIKIAILQKNATLKLSDFLVI